jgi:hypothetical protein
LLDPLIGALAISGVSERHRRVFGGNGLGTAVREQILEPMLLEVFLALLYGVAEILAKLSSRTNASAETTP